MSIIVWLILGLIASKIFNQTGEGLVLDIVLGIGGAVAGGFLFSLVDGGGGASPIPGVLMNMLGGGNQPAGMGAQRGGLGSLISSFEQARLGHPAQSWVGNGPDQLVSPKQPRTVFGDSQVQGVASQSGAAPQDFLSQLSQHLPNVVYGMTPNGQLPDEGTVSV